MALELSFFFRFPSPPVILGFLRSGFKYVFLSFFDLAIFTRYR